MKKLSALIIVLALLLLTGCAGSGSNVGDGKVDQVEAATIRVAVGLAMNAAPETVAPAYAVSTALLTGLDAGSVLLPQLEAAVETEISKLDLLPAERASALELVALVRAKIAQQLDPGGDITPQLKLIVVREVVQIVRDSAAARLGVTTFDLERFEKKLRLRVAATRAAFGAEYGEL